MRGAALLLTLAVAAGLAAPGIGQGPSLADRRRSLAEARAAAAAADARADRLAAAAAREGDAAARAAAEEQALAARVAASAADLAAAEQRGALVARLLAAQRARLAEGQRPAAQLLAGLQALAARPPIVAAAQPGSVADLVHLRAVLGGALPAVRRRTEGVRAELARTRALQQAATLAAQALRDGRVRLEADRTALAQAEARHRARAAALGRGALSESDRALALGERARDLVDRLAEEGQGQATATDLAGLPGPVPRPLPPGSRPPAGSIGVYRLPVAGRLVTGFGEVSDAGVRARGLTFAVAPGAPVAAPAGGTVRYARPFRGYGTIVIVDHGAGWSSLVTGLAAAAVRSGDAVRAGQPLGRAATGEEPQVTVELRRRGRPVDAAALVG